MRSARLRVLAALLVLCVASGCFKRPSKQEVYTGEGAEIFLRSELRWTRPVEKGYGHPVTIAPVRVAHILSRIDLRPPKKSIFGGGKEEGRVVVVPTDTLYPIAEGISKALSLADPNQEVVVMAVRDTKRWGLFDHDYLTSFVAYVRDERLYVHVSRYDWEIPKRREDRLPEPQIGDDAQRFKLFAGTAMSLVSDHAVAVDWRDPVFARPTRTRLLPSGDVVRKTILLESPPEVDDLEDPLERMPDDLSPEQLRSLADVEEDRREGRITETEYRSRRRRILSP